MIVHDCAQRSDEWARLRLGRLSASRAGDMLATLKNGSEAASRRDLRVQLCLERLTGQSHENGYINADMERGIQLEPEALAAYEAHTGHLVEPVGYCAHDSFAAGCSPDGFINDDGLVEVKCPRAANHLAYLKAQSVPKEHLPQLVHQLWITGRQWLDLVSFDPRFPESLRLFIARYHRNDDEIALYQQAVERFLAEVDREYAEIGLLMDAMQASG